MSAYTHMLKAMHLLSRNAQVMMLEKAVANKNYKFLPRDANVFRMRLRVSQNTLTLYQVQLQSVSQISRRQNWGLVMR